MISYIITTKNALITFKNQLNMIITSLKMYCLIFLQTVIKVVKYFFYIFSFNQINILNLFYLYI